MSIRKIRVTLDSIAIEEAVDHILEQYYGLHPRLQQWEVEYVDAEDLRQVKLLVEVYDTEWDESKVEEDFVEVIDD
jgi:hypothetical protein